MNGENQFCTFYLQQYFFGVEVGVVQEIIRYQEITQVPLSSNFISGLINLRGQIITAIDLRKRLDLKPLPPEKKSMNILMHLNGEIISFLVDEIGDVICVDDEDFEEPPETLTGATRELIRGAYKLKDELLLILDTQKTIYSEPEKISA